jgi:hypothetical protein
MPSDERIFVALHRSLDAFHSALAATIESLRADLDQEEESDTGAVPSGADLGNFAAGRIDASRFEALARRDLVAVEPATKDRVRQAFEVLTQLAARKNGLFRVSVEPGASLVLTVRGAFAEIGRAFGAARVVDLARTGRYQAEDHAAWLQAYPFAQWNAAERSIAPPLVVHVDAEDLRAEGLADVLDGSTKVVLVVRGDAPPAPLARLVTPGVFVQQVREEGELAALGAWRGCGIAALLEHGDVATFVHDPDAGASLGSCLRIGALPKERPTRPLGGWSAWQLEEGLRHLEALAVATGLPLADDNGAVPSDPVDKLAAWLLTQADLSNLG